MHFKRREFMGSIAAAGASLMASARPELALAQAAAPDLSFVLPELRPAARAVAGLTVRYSASALPAMRQALPAGPLQGWRSDVPVTEHRVPVPGSPDVLIYLINVKAGVSRRPAILHMHGGGYILQSAKNDVKALQSLAAELDCIIATVDYRLAPETRYSGSIADNYAGLQWLHHNAVKFGIDTRRIAVMGESAGGGHAALLALRARDLGEIPICFQMLVYPMLDDRTGGTRPPPKDVGTLLWTSQANQFAWECFLGEKPGGPDVPVAAVPARVPSLSGLPPAFIGVGGIDLFVKEDIEYAGRLVDAGVATELHVIPGAFHGFDLFAGDTNAAKTFTAAKINALKRAFSVS